ncbi:hypothetical protein UFOVP1516_71 [uncultured Caudovirales phage]|uniref:Uncharacterized protein n=1 Tax=uncultured Caudovirales phage TaxID=2100421 RepID=A0A6J7X8C7_9CAUD|nr:hypothetical protein UFOVP887_64 [uncultured Caudovirales phage]CAB5226949.1 hypothetical protein UFOVP1516_71 [uncultured Caudovirales phage]
MKALICPNEPVTNFDNTSGYRIAEVTEASFDVAEPLYWLDCNDTVVADVYYFDTATNSIELKPIAPVIAANNQPTTTGTQAF